MKLISKIIVNKKTLINEVFGDYQRGEEEADED